MEARPALFLFTNHLNYTGAPDLQMNETSGGDAAEAAGVRMLFALFGRPAI